MRVVDLTCQGGTFRKRLVIVVSPGLGDRQSGGKEDFLNRSEGGLPRLHPHASGTITAVHTRTSYLLRYWGRKCLE